MTHHEKNEVKEEPGAEDRFNQALKNALAIPPKPHVKKDGGKPKPAAKRVKPK
jgi:hypothetical protein